MKLSQYVRVTLDASDEPAPFDSKSVTKSLLLFGLLGDGPPLSSSPFSADLLFFPPEIDIVYFLTYFLL